MLTARGEEIDRIVGLELGADDYVVKPFSARELVARIRAIMRRGRAPAAAPAARSRSAPSPRSRASRTVTKDGEPVELAAKEFDLLHLLMAHAGEVVRREEIMDEVWDPHWFGPTKTLDVHISWLRKKIEDDPSNPRYITTVRGVGFRFASPRRTRRVDRRRPRRSARGSSSRSPTSCSRSSSRSRCRSPSTSTRAHAELETQTLLDAQTIAARSEPRRVTPALARPYRSLKRSFSGSRQRARADANGRVIVRRGRHRARRLHRSTSRRDGLRDTRPRPRSQRRSQRARRGAADPVQRHEAPDDHGGGRAHHRRGQLVGAVRISTR